MNALAGGFLVAVACSAPLLAQEGDRTLERIGLTLQQPVPIVRDVAAAGNAAPTTLGIFTVIPPTGRGEMVRVSVPVGDLVTRAFNGAAAANRHLYPGKSRPRRIRQTRTRARRRLPARCRSRSLA